MKCPVSIGKVVEDTRRTGGDEHARLLIFQTDIQRKDERVLHPLRHIRMPRTMIKHQPTNQLRLRRRTMLHLHDLDHMQIDRFTVLVFRLCTKSPTSDFICMICKRGKERSHEPFDGGGGRIVSTASTTSAASCFASALLIFVARDVYATLMSVGRSSLTGCLNVSKNYTERPSVH